MNRDEELKHYNLDNEYNRNIDDLKRTDNYENGRYPDLIIHKRGNNKNNLLIIECKKENNNNLEEDINKINDFMVENGKYKYKYGISIIFKKHEVIYKIKEIGKNYEEKIIKLKKFDI